MEYNIKFSCGHTGTVYLQGSMAERQRKIEYYKEEGLCKECYKKHMEEQAIKEGFKFNLSVLPEVNGEDGEMLFSAWFSGDTKPHKDEIKSLGYTWGSKDIYSNGQKCWIKIIKKGDIDKEVEKSKSIGATFVDCDITKMEYYNAALNAQRRWRKKSKKISQLNKPEVPDIIKGREWNRVIYGKSGNYTIYLDGVKTYITDAEAKEIKTYLNLNREYKYNVEVIMHE